MARQAVRARRTEGGEQKGGHCHLLAHVPADLVPTISKLQRGWLRRITGRPYKANVVRSRPIGGRLGLENSNTELLAVNRQTVLDYVVKRARLARELGLQPSEIVDMAVAERMVAERRQMEGPTTTPP